MYSLMNDLLILVAPIIVAVGAYMLWIEHEEKQFSFGLHRMPEKGPKNLGLLKLQQAQEQDLEMKKEAAVFHGYLKT